MILKLGLLTKSRKRVDFINYDKIIIVTFNFLRIILVQFGIKMIVMALNLPQGDI